MNVPLQTVQFDSPLPGPHVLITGGVHGDEFEGPAAIDRLRIQFESARFPLKWGRLTLVSIVNQPAFLRGERTAEDGLDLARCLQLSRNIRQVSFITDMRQDNLIRHRLLFKRCFHRQNQNSHRLASEKPV